MQVNIIKSPASTASDADHSLLPASVTIPAGAHAATFDVTAPVDNILEPTETLVLDGTASGFGVTGTIIQIEDSTSRNPLNTVISLLPDGISILEGSTADFNVSLPPGIVSSTPVTVQLSKNMAASTAADTDHTQLPSSITIPAFENSSDTFHISAVTDGIIEPVEILRVDGTAPAGFSFKGATIFINDATGLNPANREIRIVIDSTVLHEGSFCKVTFALPAGITTALPIPITVTADPAYSANNADYILIPANVVIPKDQNKVVVTLKAVQDNVPELDEQLRLIGTAAGFTVLPSNVVTIPGDPIPVVTVSVVKTNDAAEPSTNGLFTISLAAPAPGDVTIKYTVGGTATPDADYVALSGQAIIKSGETSVAVPVIVKDDDIVEGDETVILTLQSATFNYIGTTFNATVDNTPAVMIIADDETGPGVDRSILIEKIADAAEPATPGSVRVRFANTAITAAVPVTITYTVSGTATPDVDYQALSGTVTIPAGQREAIIQIIPKDDNLVEGVETVIIHLTGATSSLPGVTWPLAAQQSVTVNIVDDDVVTMEIFAPATAVEGTVLPVKLRASQPSATDIPVAITMQYDAARTVSTTVPRTGNTITVVLPANQTEVSFNITLVDNDINDDDGYLNLTIQAFSGTGQPYGKGSSNQSTTVVTDNDPLEIYFRTDTVRVKEGNSGITPMNFKVGLSRKSSRAIHLKYQFADAFEGAGAEKDPQRAKPGEDFVSGTTAIDIPPMQDEADIIVLINGDLDPEEDKYFIVKLTGATVASGQNVPTIRDPRTAVGVIENDDQPIDMEIRVSKALSPNGDGKNDVLLIENIEKYNRNEIVIVNRWGGTVFKTSNYNNQSNHFNGRANTGGGAGTNLPDGSYFYVLHVWDNDGKMMRYTGYIVLKR